MTKTAEELLTEISLAYRVTRDARLLALLDALKEYLEAHPRPTDKAPLDAPAGRLPSREVQLRKNNYMREWMRRKRQRDRDAKNTIINSTSPDRHRTGADDADIGEDQARQAPPQDSEA